MGIERSVKIINTHMHAYTFKGSIPFFVFCCAFLRSPNLECTSINAPKKVCMRKNGISVPGFLRKACLTASPSQPYILSGSPSVKKKRCYFSICWLCRYVALGRHAYPNDVAVKAKEDLVNKRLIRATRIIGGRHIQRLDGDPILQKYFIPKYFPRYQANKSMDAENNE